MYNYYQQQPSITGPITPRTAVAPTPQFGLKGHPVSSLEEARALSIDFDGSIFYFPDIANKRIYTKQINMDGTASLNMYELKPIPTEPTAGDFVTRAEFEQTLAKLTELFTANKEPQMPQNIEQQNPSTFKEVF